MAADIAPLGIPTTPISAGTMTVEAGVAAVPMSVFYAAGGPEHYIRFCFCKRDEVLDEQ